MSGPLQQEPEGWQAELELLLGPRHGFVHRLGRVGYLTIRRLIAHEGFELSGYAAFTAILAFFPFLVFLTALAGFVGDAESANRIITTMLRFAPIEIVDVLAPVVHQIVTQQHAELLTGSIIFALWSASSGVEALRTLLNRGYEVAETRPVWRLRPQSLAIVIVGAAMALVLSLMIVLGPLLLHVLQRFVDQEISADLWFVARYGAGSVVVIVSLLILHLLLPNCRLRLAEIWPGAVLTGVLWLVAAGLFSVYVENWSHYNVTYGSLGGIILTLLFFYISAIIFALGAEINSVIGRDS